MPTNESTTLLELSKFEVVGLSSGEFSLEVSNLEPRSTKISIVDVSIIDKHMDEPRHGNLQHE